MSFYVEKLPLRDFFVSCQNLLKGEPNHRVCLFVGYGIRQIENPAFFDMRFTSAKMSLLFKSSNVLKRAQAYPVCEFILLNFNHIRLTAIPTAEECHLLLGQLLQHKQQQLVVVTTVSQVLRKCLLEI